MANTNPTIEPTETDLAYVAGIVDGEGTIGIYESVNQYKLFVSIKMCEKAAIDYIANRFYGVTNWYINDLNKYVYRVTFNGAKGYRFIKQIRKYTKVKTAQIDKAIEFYETCGKIGRGTKLLEEEIKLRKEYVLALKEMKIFPQFTVEVNG